MAPVQSRPPSIFQLDLLARLEQLIEGLGQAARMVAASLTVGPSCFLRASPPALVHRGVRRRLFLPPLVFLLLACFLLLELIETSGTAATSPDPELALEQRWQELKRFDPWSVLARAGAVFLVLWLGCEIVATGLARVVNSRREPLRQALLYLCSLAVTISGIATVVIMGVISRGEGTVYATPWFVLVSRPFALLLWLIPLLLACGLGLKWRVDCADVG